jgi:hypothetical protein
MEGRERQFDGTVFLAFVRTLFLLFLSARHKGNLQPVRTHFSPGLFKAWQDFKPVRVERRRTVRPINYEVQSAELINHYQFQDMEVAIVQFAGLAVPVDPNRKVSPRPLRERWTFTRPIVLMGQICPSCGAPWKLTAWGKCPSCGRDFSGTNDGWTVAGLENLLPTADPNSPFREENAFLDYWDDRLRQIAAGRPL